jgi:hypothetical protein
MDHQSNYTENYVDDDQNDILQTPHAPAGQDETVPTGQPVADWLEGVSSNPDSVPHTHFTDPRTGLLQTPETPGKKTHNAESDQDQLDTHDGGTSHGLDDPTVQKIAATLGQDVRVEKDSPGGHGNLKPDHVNTKDPAGNRRPWYADGDVQAIFRALVWAVLCAVPLFGLVLFLADQDAERFP